MFLDQTQRLSTVGRTPLEEWSARRRGLYLTTYNTHNRPTSMLSLGFEPTISAGERPQTYALGRAATGTGSLYSCDCTITQPLQSVLSSKQRATAGHILFIADSYRVSKSLMSSGKFWMVSPDPEQPITPQLVPIMKNGYYYKLGVFLDYDCNASKQYLDEVSASHHDRYHFLYSHFEQARN